MSKIEVNQISSQCGSTLTVGQSGDTVTLAAGATQTGFGRTGTVDWDTTAKTASFTAVSGDGYFVNTTSGAITLTLPASPSAGDIVSFKDYAFTFATNNLTVDGNGSPIGGVDGTILPTYDTNGTSKTFIYVDGTKGWLVTNESTDTSQESNASFVTATGGTILTCGDYKTHIFTGPGTFCVSCAGNAEGSNSVDYLVVAGGGGGGKDNYTAEARGRGGAGAGAGGFRLSNFNGIPAPTISPLANPTGIPVTATSFPIVVGAGGAAGPTNPTCDGAKGNTSSFSTISSAGGGAGPGTNSAGSGGGSPPGCYAGGNGSGLGTDPNNGTTPVFSPSSNLIQGNQPPVSPIQGNPGGGGAVTPAAIASGGGGGAGCRGEDAPAATQGGAGGSGSFVSDTFFGPTAPSYGTPGPVSSTRYFAGGGGGKGTPGSGGAGGTGGGAAGGGPGAPLTAATANTGGGGGGGDQTASAGGSGIVIIRYKFQ